MRVPTGGSADEVRRLLDLLAGDGVSGGPDRRAGAEPRRRVSDVDRPDAGAAGVRRAAWGAPDDRSVTATGRSRAYWAVSDSLTMIRRSIRRTTRELDALLLAVLLPVMLMLLFVYVFGGAIQTGTAYINYVVPGIILLCAGYGAANTAVAVANDMTNGIVDRFRSMPILELGGADRPRGGQHRAQPASPRHWCWGWPSPWGSGRPPGRSSGWPPLGCSRCSCWPCPGSPRSPG